MNHTSPVDIYIYCFIYVDQETHMFQRCETYPVTRYDWKVAKSEADFSDHDSKG